MGASADWRSSIWPHKNIRTITKPVTNPEFARLTDQVPGLAFAVIAAAGSPVRLVADERRAESVRHLPHQQQHAWTRTHIPDSEEMAEKKVYCAESLIITVRTVSLLLNLLVRWNTAVFPLVILNVGFKSTWQTWSELCCEIREVLPGAPAHPALCRGVVHCVWNEV